MVKVGIITKGKIIFFLTILILSGIILFGNEDGSSERIHISVVKTECHKRINAISKNLASWDELVKALDGLSLTHLKKLKFG